MITISNHSISVIAQDISRNQAVTSKKDTAVSDSRKVSSEEGIILSISEKGRRLAERSLTDKGNSVRKLSDGAVGREHHSTKIQKYVSRSIQLGVQASQENLSETDKRIIRHEISKIHQEIWRLNDVLDGDTSDMVEKDISMSGDVVSSSRTNILNQAKDAFYAQGAIDSSDALVLLS